MTENIAKDKNKHSKLGIAYAAVGIGGSFVYLGLIIIVLYKPEIMTWVGLEPFVAYLIELQPAGYENLVRLNSPAFADYFFHIHAATVLIYVFSFLIVITTTLSANKSDQRKPIDFEKIKNDLQTYNIGLLSILYKHNTIGLSLGFLFITIFGWFLFLSPEQMEIKSKFPPNNNGVGLYVLFSSLYSFFFIGSSAFFCTLLHLNYWPKLRSWLVNKQKADQKIKHRAKQLTKR